MAMDPYRLTDTPTNGCEGCWHCQFAGIRWPASPDGFQDLSYVDRCDSCELYDDDEEAATALAEHFGVRWGYAYRTDPTQIRWEPASDDGLNYTGWSCFIDRPERDGFEPARPGGWAALNLNPGQARLVLEALRELAVSSASEFQAGEMFAVVQHQSIEVLVDAIEHQLNAKT